MFLGKRRERRQIPPKPDKTNIYYLIFITIDLELSFGNKIHGITNVEDIRSLKNKQVCKVIPMNLYFE